MSKSKNQFFDMRLYKEGIRQLRIPGVVSGVILLLCGTLMPLMQMIEMYDRQQYWTSEGITGVMQTILELYTVNCLLWICPYILAVVMPIMLFRFLNQRNSSDFYHSIPQTRVCVAVSFLLAVLTWVIGLLVGAGLLSCLFAEALPYLTVDWSNVLQLMVQLVTASILAVGGTFLAISVTGTIFTNFAVAMMLLYVPTVLAVVLEANVVGKLYFVQSISEMLLYKYNNLTNLMLSLFDFSESSTLISAVYTTVLGILYGMIGVCMYHRRNSEAAGKSASSSWLKAVFRVTPAFVLTLIPLSMIYQQELTDSTEVFLIVVIYIVAVVVYFLYELFSTGKWKSAVQSLKGLWLLAVLNVVSLLIVNGITLYAQNCLPRADEIVSVRFMSDSYNYYGQNLEETELTSEEICTFTSKALKHTVKNLNEDTYWNYYDNCRSVAIETKWGTIYRYLYLTYAQEQELSAILAKSEAYKNVYLSLPDLQEWEVDSSYTWKDSGSAERVYQVLKSELQEIGFEDWYNYINTDASSEWAYLSFDKVGGNGYLHIPISLRMLPKTYAQYVEELAVETSEARLQYLSSVFEKISTGELGGDVWFTLLDIEADRYVGENWIYGSYEEWEYTEEVVLEEQGFASVEVITQSATPAGEIEDDSAYCGAILSEIFAREPVTEHQYYLIVSGEIYGEDEWTSLQDTAIYITEEEAQSLKQTIEY